MNLLQDERAFKAACAVFAVCTAWWLLGGFTDTSLTLNQRAEQLIGDTGAPELLDRHTHEFRQEIVRVTKGVYMAIGYAIANSILIEGPEGAIIVDTTESMNSGREIYAAFRNITKAPIKAIVYTHNHADHMYGTAAFIDDEDNLPEIWAHETLPYLVDATTTVLPLTFARAMRQFGTKLREMVPKAFRNAGIGPYLRVSADGQAVLIQPTHLMSGETMDVVMAGLPVTIVHIPGETYDQIGLWIPSKRAFLCADDLYRTFPNLYAIRGTPARDTLHWVRSVDKMIAYEPEFIVPSHSRPLEGRDYIQSVLVAYRDAIKHVHDQTVRYMNKGMFPDDIVTMVSLPKSLRENPFLLTHYGTVEWSVRAVFDRYMGWFSGNIAELARHSTKEKAKRMISLAGGEKAILNAARQAVGEADFKWALELSSQVFALNREHSEARQIRLECLKALASQQMSANGRNYYLTVALEDHGFVDAKVPEMARKASVMFMKPEKLFEVFTLRLKAEEVEGVEASLVLNLTDIEEVYTLRLRNSVLDVLPGIPEKWTVKVTIDYEIWKGIIAGDESPLKMYINGQLQVEGGMVEFKKFMSYIDAS